MASVTAEAIRQNICLLRFSLCGRKLLHDALRVLVLVMGAIAAAARQSVVLENLPPRQKQK
jgi:hypothetical protein